MEQYLSLTKRNLKIYLKDKGAVFFSLLSMAIVICLMLFFLGDMTINAITNILIYKSEGFYKLWNSKSKY